LGRSSGIYIYRLQTTQVVKRFGWDAMQWQRDRQLQLGAFIKQVMGVTAVR